MFHYPSTYFSTSLPLTKLLFNSLLPSPSRPIATSRPSSSARARRSKTFRATPAAPCSSQARKTARVATLPSPRKPAAVSSALGWGWALVCPWCWAWVGSSSIAAARKVHLRHRKPRRRQARKVAWRWLLRRQGCSNVGWECVGCCNQIRSLVPENRIFGHIYYVGFVDLARAPPRTWEVYILECFLGVAKGEVHGTRPRGKAEVSLP